MCVFPPASGPDLLPAALPLGADQESDAERCHEVQEHGWEIRHVLPVRGTSWHAREAAAVSSDVDHDGNRLSPATKSALCSAPRSRSPWGGRRRQAAARRRMLPGGCSCAWRGSLRCRLTNAVPTQTFVMVLWIPVKWLPGAHSRSSGGAGRDPAAQSRRPPLHPAHVESSLAMLGNSRARGNKPARGELKCPISALPKFQ